MIKFIAGFCAVAAVALAVVGMVRPDLVGLKSNRPAEPAKVATTQPPAATAEKSGCGSDGSCCCAAQAKKCACGSDEPEVTPARLTRSISTIGLIAAPTNQNLLLASSTWIAGREKK